MLLLARTTLGAALNGGGGGATRRRRIGLSALSELVLGLPLDKSEQCSSWGTRRVAAPVPGSRQGG